MNYRLELQIWKLNEDSLSLAHKIVSKEHPDRAKLYDGKYTDRIVYDSIASGKNYWIIKMIFDFMCKMIQSKGFVMRGKMLFYVPVITAITEIDTTNLNDKQIVEKQNQAIKNANESKNLYHSLELSYIQQQQNTNNQQGIEEKEEIE